MRVITLLFSAISVGVLYVLFMILLPINIIYSLIGAVIEAVTDFISYFLDDQLDVFKETMEGL